MVDYLLGIVFLIGLLVGGFFTAVALLYYAAQEKKKDQKKLAQELSAKLTHEFNKEKEEIVQKQTVENNQAKFGRQRLAKKQDELFAQLRTKNRDIENLHYQIKDAEYVLNQANNDVKVAQDDHAKLQNAHQQLASDYRAQQVRLEAVKARADECKKQLEKLEQQLDQATKIQDALIFATNELRQTRVANQVLKNRVAYKEETSIGEVGLGFKDVDGLEPVHAVRLFEAGIHTPTALRNRSPYEIAQIAGVAPELALAWINSSNSQMFDN